MLRAEILRGGVGGLGVPSHAQRPARTNCDVHGQLCGSHRLCYGNTRSVDQISDPMTAARRRRAKAGGAVARRPKVPFQGVGDRIDDAAWAFPSAIPIDGRRPPHRRQLGSSRTNQCGGGTGCFVRCATTAKLNCKPLPQPTWRHTAQSFRFPSRRFSDSGKDICAHWCDI